MLCKNKVGLVAVERTSEKVRPSSEPRKHDRIVGLSGGDQVFDRNWKLNQSIVSPLNPGSGTMARFGFAKQKLRRQRPVESQ